ncbi:trigger factor [Microlunatus ginsengisoli]|uniref:Trigger factor n=1 Tax=Microlunatus ginsengisoli TaxID=363863 RepID=A0ABP6ZPC1_9ACTN
MPSTVEQLTPSRVKITVEVPFTELKPSMDKAYRDIAKQVNIPGFRRGKVPPMVIDQRFGRGAIIEQALNDALPRFYGDAVSENKLTPLAQPEVEVTRLEDGDLIEFTAEVDVRPEFDLPDFSLLSATVDAAEVDEAEIDDRLETLRQRFGSRIAVERPAADGDVVTIDLVATRDGESLEDATAEGIDYTIGSGGMLDGLDDAVIGLSAGESAEFTSTLVGGPLKDTDADIKVTVSKVQEEELPALDDEFAQQASEFDTYDEMRADFAESLLRLARLDQASKARDAVLEDLIAKVAVEVPENLRESDLAARKESITNQLSSANLTLAQYLEDTEEAESEEEFWEDLEKRSADALLAQIILDKVAEERGLSVDQNDLTQHIIRKAQQEGSTPQQVADHLQEHPHHIDEYMQEIRRGKALALIVESATVTDTDGNPVDLANLQADGTLATPGESAESEEAGEPEEIAASETVGSEASDLVEPETAEGDDAGEDDDSK